MRLSTRPILFLLTAALFICALSAARAAQSELDRFGRLWKAGLSADPGLIEVARDLADSKSFILADYALYRLVELLREQGQTDRASAQAERFLRQMKHSPLQARVRALKLELDCLEPTSEICRLALDRFGSDRSDRATSDLLGYLHALRAFELADHRTAREILISIHYDRPGSPYAALAKSKLDRINEIRPDLERSSPIPLEKRLKRAQNLFKLFRYGQARAIAESIGADRRASAKLKGRAILLSARASVRLKERERAAKEFLRYLRMERASAPEFGAARYELAMTRWNLHESEKAIEGLNRILRAKSSSEKKFKTDSLDALGRIYESRAEHALAARHYRKALERADRKRSDEYYLFKIGWMSYLAGDYLSARSLFEKGAARAGAKFDADRLLYWSAKSAEKAGMPIQAAQTRAKLVAGYPTSLYRFLSDNAARANRFGRYRGDRIGSGDFDLGELAFNRLEKFYSRNKRARALLDRFAALESVDIDELAKLELARLRALRAGRADASEKAMIGLLYQRIDEYLSALATVERPSARTFPSGRMNSAQIDPETASWLIYYPLGYGRLVIYEARAKGIDPFLTLALIRRESFFDRKAISPANARGLMQLIAPTARRVYHESGMRKRLKRALDLTDLYDPSINTQLGVSYLSTLLKRYDGKVARALAAYNAGENAVDRWDRRFGALEEDEFIERIVYPETEKYVKNTLQSWARYHLVYNSNREGE